MTHCIQYPDFNFNYNDDSGSVTTEFKDGTYNQTFVNNDDAYHADLLGIEPKTHRILHECSHHLVAIKAFNQPYCPIIYNDAHWLPMPDNAEMLEWMITSISYFAFRKPMRHAHEWKAIMHLSEQVDVYELSKDIIAVIDKLRN